MALFKVIEVIDGNTIKVARWQWNEEYSGNLVKIQGYSIADKSYEEYVKNKLKTLLDGKSVELKRVIKADKGEGTDQDIVYCSVFLNEIDISTYFGELKAQ